MAASQSPSFRKGIKLWATTHKAHYLDDTSDTGVHQHLIILRTYFDQMLFVDNKSVVYVNDNEYNVSIGVFLNCGLSGSKLFMLPKPLHFRAQENGEFVQVSKPDAKRYEGVYGYMEDEPLSDLHHLNGAIVLESTEKELQTFLLVLKNCEIRLNPNIAGMYGVPVVSTQTYSVGKHSLGEEVPIDTIHHTIEKGSKVKPTSFHNLPPTSFDLTEEEGPLQNDFSTYFNDPAGAGFAINGLTYYYCALYIFFVSSILYGTL